MLTDFIVYSGEALKKARKAQGFRIDEFAAMIGVSSGYLSNVENSKKTPKIEEVSKIRKILGVPPIVIM